MKITKTFGMTISGNYQSYKFETSADTDTDEPRWGGLSAEAVSLHLSAMVVAHTEDDVQKYAAADPNFAAVLGTRNTELEKVRVRQAHTS